MNCKLSCVTMTMELQPCCVNSKSSSSHCKSAAECSVPVLGEKPEEATLLQHHRQRRVTDTTHGAELSNLARINLLSMRQQEDKRVLQSDVTSLTTVSYSMSLQTPVGKKSSLPQTASIQATLMPFTCSPLCLFFT